MYAFDSTDCLEWLWWILVCWETLENMPSKMEDTVEVLDTGPMPTLADGQTLEE